ncbi:MAG: hypothetical protein AB1393_02830 [Candidatus Edwardsbacteria bacterium]
MHQQLELLIMLHDLEEMIRESLEAAISEESLGFKLSHQEDLKKAYAEVEKRLQPELLVRYRKLKERYERAIVPVVNGVCCGCYMRMPIALATSKDKNVEVTTCENCGRFLYWTE